MDLDLIRAVPYTGSQPLRLPRGQARGDGPQGHPRRAPVLPEKKEIREGAAGGPEDFDDREIEICFWSRKAPDLAPAGRASLVLRVGFPYERSAALADRREGKKRRIQGIQGAAGPGPHPDRGGHPPGSLEGYRGPGDCDASYVPRIGATVMKGRSPAGVVPRRIGPPARKGPSGRPCPASSRPGLCGRGAFPRRGPDSPLYREPGRRLHPGRLTRVPPSLVPGADGPGRR